MKNVSFNVFSIFWTLWHKEIAKFKKRNLKVFKINIWSFYKTFCRKWEGETLPKWFFIFKQLEKCQKILSKFNNLNFYCLRSSQRLTLHISLLKRNLWSCSKWPISEGKIWTFFMASKKEIYFSYKAFVSYICWQGYFFSRIYWDGIKIVFHNIWRDFQMTKRKHSNTNF